MPKRGRAKDANEEDKFRKYLMSVHNTTLKLRDGDLECNYLTLVGRSSVFQAMFTGPMKERDLTNVVIPDCSKAAMEVVVQWAHFQDYTITEDNVLEVLFAAKKYMLQDLETETRKCLEDHIAIENVAFLWDQATLLPDEELVSECLDFMLKNGQTFLHSDEFLQIGEQLLRLLLGSDALAVCSELICFNALHRWVQHHYKDSITHMIAEFLPLIGLPLLTSAELCQVAQSGVVSDRLLVQLFTAQSKQTSASIQGFRSTRRKGAVNMACAKAFLYGRDGVTQDWYKGVDVMRQLSDAGDDYAMVFYADCLWSGAGVKEDENKAEQLFGASQHPYARFRQNYNGIGVDQDLGTAFRILSTECDQTDPMVLYMMGMCKSDGFGCAVDDAAAVAYFQQAGTHALAVCDLGYMYDHGRGVAKDCENALQLYLQSAQQGSSVAMYNLAEEYENRLAGSPENQQKSLVWYSKAAALGNKDAAAEVKRLLKEIQ